MKIRNLFGGLIPFKTFKFPGGEVNVKIEGILPSLDIEIIQRITCSDDIMELLLATDALRRAGGKRIDLVLPYVPYARQDRVMTEGESLSIKVFCDLINAQNYNSVTVFDPHSDITPALLNNCSVRDNVSLVLNALSCMDILPTIVSPDAGALKKIYNVAKQVGYGEDVIVGAKKRNVSTGQITGTSINADVKGNCVIIDDICDGGRTFIELAKVLKVRGANKVFLIVSHGIFSAGFAELGKHLDGIFVTDSYRTLAVEEYQNLCNVTQFNFFR